MELLSRQVTVEPRCMAGDEVGSHPGGWQIARLGAQGLAHMPSAVADQNPC